MNVNLAILNCRRSVLDGALIPRLEDSPRLSTKVLNYIQTGCASVALIAFMPYIAFDVQELPWEKGQPIQPQFPKEQLK
jgi:hypothetical protein